MPNKTILIADDDAGLVRALSVRLTHEGYRVLTSFDAYHALDQAVKLCPDLMVLDVHMPAGKGFDVMNRVGRISALATIPVLFMTGDDNPKLRERAEQMGSEGIFQKPFSTKEMVEKIYSVLRRSPYPGADTPSLADPAREHQLRENEFVA